MSYHAEKAAPQRNEEPMMEYEQKIGSGEKTAEEIVERTTGYEAAEMAINSVVEEVRAEQAAKSENCEGRTSEAAEAEEENKVEDARGDVNASSVPSTSSLIDDIENLSYSMQCSDNHSGRDDKENEPERVRIGSGRYGLRTISDFPDDEQAALFEKAKKIANKAEFSR
ncbi:unnamed protein product [Gongylonema pulchrum]|uniref:Ovule protein n=1 Tax=Gongylonema pulchrum TaxID=637853 RepID=A0A183EGE4_9BILA|nr:unnamed protein product [Gongylonema pulchrum]